METRIAQLRHEATTALENAVSLQALEAMRVQFLGKKGTVTELRRTLATLPVEQRPAAGKTLNELVQAIETAMSEAQTRLAAKELDSRLAMEQVDITLPGRQARRGHQHPVSQTVARIREIFTTLGFEEVEGPEVESEYYNFDALNTPPHHPARDMHDTFYLTNGLLLRTHTSPTQIRVMEQRQPPIRILVPGRVYRKDADASHSPMFHQVEGLLVDKGIRFSDLKGMLATFTRQMFGEKTQIRFRPSFFPFTEPSAEVDVSCYLCGGSGCRVCKGTGWVEILGAGSVDPEVFAGVGYDPEVYSGFAFGMGVDRIAINLFGVNHIRLLFENDMRFLTQF